jgi:glutamine synthetase
MADIVSLKRRIEEEEIEFVDFRVSDVAGRFRHVTVPAGRVDERLVREGIGFDGSNYGYCGVSGSDMILIPDLSTAFSEERGGERILSVIGDVVEAATREPAGHDPRRIAEAALAHVQREGIADDVRVSPEFEFYVFDDVLFGSDSGRNAVEISCVEGCEYSEETVPCGQRFSAYHAPVAEDRLFALRCEMCRQISEAGIPVKYHHHEVGSFGQQEIELGFGSLVEMADTTQIVKSIVRAVADDVGLTATFMPKPLFGEPGSGLHLHQYLVSGKRNLFAGEGELSEIALCYVGGLLAHGRSLMALTNPSTNSYRRLVPGYEAPVSFVFGSANRSAAVRVPGYTAAADRRIELRTTDATCNPYLAFAAVLLAGIDGIKRNLNAAELGYGPYEKNASRETDAEAAPPNLSTALAALEEDHAFLTESGVFPEPVIDAWVRTKRQEIDAVSARPHPHEFSLYYDL